MNVVMWMLAGAALGWIGISHAASHRKDIFLWPGGFWCYREEFSPAMLRGAEYRVIRNLSAEWSSY